METSKGYVYIMINPSYSGVVKIGKTTKDPEERAKELSSATGVATPFIVVYKHMFNNCHIAERVVHGILDEQGYRVNDSREFFSVDISTAIDIILNIPDEDVPEITEFEPLVEEDDSLAEHYFSMGMDYYYGLNDTFQDVDLSLDYFEKSAVLGKIEAYYRMGRAWFYEKGNEYKALQCYHEGAKKGYARCYAELGRIYLNKDSKQYNRRNADLAWSKYFEFIDELAKTDNFYWEWDITGYGEDVIAFIFNMLIQCEQINPKHEEFLYKYVRDIYRVTRDKIEKLREEYPSVSEFYENKIIPFIKGLEEKYLLTHGEGVELGRNHCILGEKYLRGVESFDGLENYPKNVIKSLNLFAKSAELGYHKAYIYMGLAWLECGKYNKVDDAWKKYYNSAYDLLSGKDFAISEECKNEILDNFIFLIFNSIGNDIQHLIHEEYVFLSLKLDIINYILEKIEEITNRDCYKYNVSEDLNDSELDNLSDDERMEYLHRRTEYLLSEHDKRTITTVFTYIKDYTTKLYDEKGALKVQIKRID